MTQTPEWFPLVEKAHAVASLFEGTNPMVDAALEIAEQTIARARLALLINEDVAEDTAEAAAKLDALVAAGGITRDDVDAQLAELRQASETIRQNNARLMAQVGT